MMILFVKLTKGIGHKFCQLMKSSPIGHTHFVWMVSVIMFAKKIFWQH